MEPTWKKQRELTVRTSAPTRLWTEWRGARSAASSIADVLGVLLVIGHIRRWAIPAMSITPSRNQVLRGQGKRKAYHALTGLAAVAGATALWAGTTVEWKGGGGNWEDAVMWGGTLPMGATEARINGTKERPSQVTLARADVLVSHLSIAEGSSNVASLVLDGPSLTVSGSFDVGKYNGSNGRFLVKSGHVFAGTIFVSGGGGPGMRGRGTLEIQAGSVVTKDIELG